LRDQREIADVGIDTRESGVESKIRADDPQAIRTQQADAVTAGNLHHFSFERSARMSRLGKARGDHDGVLDATVPTLFDDFRDRLRSGHDHRQFDAGADLFDRFVGRDALYRFVGGVDRV